MINIYLILKNCLRSPKLIPILVLGVLLFARKASAQTIYVATNGNDNSSGQITTPLKTIGAAIKQINLSKNTSATLYIRQGRYSINETILITQSKKNIKITAYNGEKVTLSGGVQINPDKFIPVTDNQILQRLTKEARKNVLVVNLKNLGIIDMGVLKQTGFGKTRLPAPLELFIDNSPLSLARWPNEGKLQVGKVIQAGIKSSANQNLPIFQYTYSRPESWKNSNDIWVSGIFSNGWADDNLPIKSIDLNKKVITLKEQAIYGVKSREATGTMAISGAVKGYYFYNVLEELDAPGEWYLDRSSFNLYVWPKKNIKSSTPEVSLLEKILFRLVSTSNVSIENLNFNCTRGMFMMIQKSNNILINNCVFMNGGLIGIKTSQSTNITIKNSDFKSLGSGAVALDGGNRQQLTPSNSLVQGCNFDNYSRLYNSYSPAISLSGVGNIAKNCFIHDSPGQAIIFSGNNHSIINNKIDNTCYGFSDIGSIYTGRDPSATGNIIQNNYFSNINGLSNLVTAVYIDDGSGGQNISGNFFYKSGSTTTSGYGAVHINGGAYNILNNNIFMDCGLAFSNTYWTDERWNKQFVLSADGQKKLLQTVNIKSAAYLKQYPHLKGFFDGATPKERKNIINNTVLINTKKLSTGNGYTSTNTLSYADYAGFIIDKSDPENIRITRYPDNTKTLKQWKPIDFSNIGVKR